MELSQGSKNQLVVVVGMHRSGTSALARALPALGVELGNRLMPPIAGENDKGFWEDLDVNELNIEILRRLGAEWDSLELPMDLSFEEDGMVPLRPRGVELLRG